METSVTTVVDLDMKVGASKKGPWTLCTLTGFDKEKYKTFDENIIAQLRQAQAKGAPIAITWVPEPRSYIDRAGQKVDTIERTIKTLAPAAPSATPPPAAKAFTPERRDKMPPEYWENKDRTEYARMAHMSALKACADLMAACIEAKTEKMGFEESIDIVKREADSLYAAYFMPYEKGADHGSDQDSGSAAVNQ